MQEEALHEMHAQLLHHHSDVGRGDFCGGERLVDGCGQRALRLREASEDAQQQNGSKAQVHRWILLNT